MANELNISELVDVLPVISYRDSLSEMLNANALLLLQGELFNNQVPSKLYDYIRARKPVVANTPSNSATADIISTLDNAFSGNDIETLKAAIVNVIGLNAAKDHSSKVDITRFSRHTKTIELASLLDTVVS